MSIVIGRPVEGISLNGLEYLMNEKNQEYMLFESKRHAMDFLNTLFEEPLTDEELEDGFMFLDTEKDFENPQAFENETN